MSFLSPSFEALHVLLNDLFALHSATSSYLRGIMSALADLQAAVTKLQADVTALLAAQHPPADSVSAADAEAATAALAALDAQIVAATPAPAA